MHRFLPRGLPRKAGCRHDMLHDLWRPVRRHSGCYPTSKITSINSAVKTQRNESKRGERLPSAPNSLRPYNYFVALVLCATMLFLIFAYSVADTTLFFTRSLLAL